MWQAMLEDLNTLFARYIRALLLLAIAVVTVVLFLGTHVWD